MRKMRWTCCCCCCCWGRWRCCCCCCCWCCWPVPPWPVVVGDWSPHRPPRPSLRNGQTDGNLLAWGHRQRCSPPMLGMPAMPAMRARPPQQQESRPLAAAAENQGPVGAGWGWDAGDSSDSRPGIPAMPAIPPPPRPAASRHTQTGRDVADSRHPAHGQAKMLEDARQDARPASHNREKVGTGQQVDEDGGK